MEREARFYSYAVALYGYLLCVSALANCNNILAGGAILPHLTDAVCIELRFNLFRFPFFVSRFHLFSLFSLRRYARLAYRKHKTTIDSIYYPYSLFCATRASLASLARALRALSV